MKDIIVNMELRCNPFYMHATCFFAGLKWKKPAVFFANKWANSYRYRVEGGSWRKLDADIEV